MISSHFGRQVRQRRAALGLGQEALCAKAGVSRTVLSRLESERGAPVQTDVLERLAAGLDTKVIVSLGDHGGERVEARLRHRLHQAELRERHLRLALDLSARPREAGPTVRRALQQVDLWERRKACSPRYIEGWRAALSHRDPRSVALAMTSFGEWEDAMFQNSPWSFLWS